MALDRSPSRVDRGLGVLFILLIFLLPAGVAAQEIVIASPSNIPPKSYLEDGVGKGLYVDILEWVLQDAGYRYKFEFVPWKRGYYMAETGKAGIAGLSKTSDRLKIFDYSDPIYVGELVIVVKQGKEFEFESIEDLAGKSLAILRGSSFGDRYQKAVADELFTVVDITSLVYGLHMLLAGRVDGMILGPGEYGLKSAVAQGSDLRVDQFSILPRPFKRDAEHLGFHKSLDMKPFLEKFNASLEKSRRLNIQQEIIDRHFPVDR